MRFYIFHFTEFFCIVCPALIMMNETEDGKFPKPGKLAGAMLGMYLCGLAGNILTRLVEQPAEGIIRILMALSYLFFGSILFTGGVAKILLSIIILDTWMGAGEILMSILYCVICGKDLVFVFLFQYEEHIFLQWIIQIGVGFLMLFVSRKLFYKYKKSPILEEKVFAILSLFYIVIEGAILTAKPIGLHGNKDYPYYLTLFLITAFSCTFLILLCQNQNKIMEAKFQSLYLKQKMEREYALVFADMDRDMRRFRHDVKKHMDALSYLAENREINVPIAQFQKYQQDLKEIYKELTYGNYCSKYDINLVLMEMENACCRYNAEFSVNLKTLDLDSLPVHIRVQMFENLIEWAENIMSIERTVNVEKSMSLLSFEGMSSAGFHTLKVSLRQECLADRKKRKQKYIRKHIFNGKTAGKIKKLLYENSPVVKIECNNESQLLVIGWHGGETS